MKQTVHKDVTLSILMGPAKRLVPAIGYYFLYPIILTKSGVAVLGLWSLLATVASYVNLTDIGFSKLLIREAGQDKSESELYQIKNDYLAARRSYTFMGAIVGAMLLVVGKDLFGLLGHAGSVYPVSALTIAIIFLVSGAFIELIAKLDAAILSARNDNYFVQVTLAVSPFLIFSVAIGGALLGKPIEGLALGSFLRSSLQFLIYGWRLRSTHVAWHTIRVTLPWRETWKRIKRLLSRGFQLYLISLGFLFREPAFRLVIVLSLGLEAAGIYDIAMRLAQTIRNVVSSGFTVLYPSLAYLCRTDRYSEVKELLRVSLMLLLAIGAGTAGLLILATGPLLMLWLGEIPDGVVMATRVLSVWVVITLANVSFWHLLQATENERAASLSIWLHTGCILILLPICKIVSLDLFAILLYWTFASLLTQLLIYVNVERKLSLFWEVVLEPRVVLIVGISVISLVAAFLISPMVIEMGATMLWWFGGGLFAASYAVLIVPIIWKPVRKFARIRSWTYIKPSRHWYYN